MVAGILTLTAHGALAHEYGTSNIMSAVIEGFAHAAEHKGTEGFGHLGQLSHRWASEGELPGRVYLNWADDADVCYSYTMEFQWLGISPPVMVHESDWAASSNMHDVIQVGSGGKDSKIR